MLNGTDNAGRGQRPRTPSLVTCWSVSVDDPEAGRRCLALLPAGEQRRVSGFAPPHRHRRACAQAAARILVAAELGGGAGLNCLTRTDEGRLVLARRPTAAHPDGSTCAPLDVSLSYSGGYAVIALSGCGTVGVDIEASGAFGVAEERRLARFSLAASEYAQWRAADPELRALLLARAWTRKEAVLKALGLGLAGDVRAVVTRLMPAVAHGTEAAEIVALPAAAGEPGRWTLRDLPDGPDHIGSIAVGAADVSVRHRWCSILDLLKYTERGTGEFA